MKEIIKIYLSKLFTSDYEIKVMGKGTYYQIFLEPGMCINIEQFRHAIDNVTDEFINIDVSCCIDGEDDKYKLLIEVYW